MTRPRIIVTSLAIATLAVAAYAQAPTSNPADQQHAPAAPAPVKNAGTWELPAITVPGQPAAELREEDLIGTYAQPRWTSHRRFPRSRVYVIPDGELQFEYWARFDVPKHGGATEVQNFYELEMGLPHRMQLDYYLVTRNEGEGGPTFLDQQFEGRYAFADWGVLPGNPTIYGEYALIDEGPDKVEFKLLLGDQLAPGWHWGANGVYEAETGGEREHEYAGTFGISRTIIDEKSSLGAEAEYALTDVKDDRGNYEESIYLGPSLQLRPRPNMHINLAPLFGISSDAKELKAFINVGWEF